MSLTKRYLLDPDNRFDFVEKYICGQCVGDQILASLVADNLKSHVCSYCHTDSHTRIAAPFATIMLRICDAISQYYADAQDVHAPVEDGGWALENVYPGDILDEFDPGWNEELLEDILECLIREDKYWIPHSEHDWGLANPTQALLYGWQSFTRTVLHKTRYLFLSEPEDELDASRPDYVSVPGMLDSLGRVVANLNLVTRLNPGTIFYRAREGSYTKFHEVSVPPSGKASAGRMNPAGIPYLYVALDGETAKREIKSKSKKVTLATFATKVPLRLLNLTNLPPLPSLFELEKYKERHQLEFLSIFSREISKPVPGDCKEHLEYIPTQIVSEFFRHRFFHEKQNLDGVLYRSSETNGRNVALFVSDQSEVKRMMNLTKVEIVEPH